MQQQSCIKGMHILCSWWIGPFLVSMSAYEIHCARPRAMTTETLMFLMRRSMCEASHLKLQFVPEHLYFSRFLGTPLLQFVG